MCLHLLTTKSSSKKKRSRAGVLPPSCLLGRGFFSPARWPTRRVCSSGTRTPRTGRWASTTSSRRSPARWPRRTTSAAPSCFRPACASSGCTPSAGRAPTLLADGACRWATCSTSSFSRGSSRWCSARLRTGPRRSSCAARSTCGAASNRQRWRASTRARGRRWCGGAWTTFGSRCARSASPTQTPSWARCTPRSALLRPQRGESRAP